MHKLMAITLINLSIVNISSLTWAAPLAPLAEVTPIGQPKLYFDPSKIVAVYPNYLYTAAGPKPITIHQGPLKTHVSGVNGSDFPIDTDAPTFLTNLHLLDKFVMLHGIAGDIYLKSTSVASVSAAPAKVIDARIKTWIYPGPAGPGGSKEFWQVFETPDKVKQLIDTVRGKPDAGDM
jgi:hypothetical protein